MLVSSPVIHRANRAEQVLTGLPHPLIVLQPDRRLVFVNPSAEQLFAAGQACRSAARLMSVGQLQAKQLEALLRQASGGASAQAGLWFATAPKVGWVSSSLLAPGAAAAAEWPAQSLLLSVQIEQPELTQDARIEVLCRQCGLTRTERYVLLLLADGLAVEAAAMQLGLRVSTLRTHVRNMLGKTRAPSLMQLLRWLGSGAPLFG